MLFYLSLSPQAFQELMSMQLEIQMVPYDSNIPDSWNFSWGNSQDTSGRFYQLAFKHLVLPNTFKWVWKSKCTPRLKFFAWLILLDKLNTKDMLQRRNFHVQPNNHCVMCNSGVVEDLRHLFFEGPFEAVCWQKLGIVWDPTARASAFWCDFFHWNLHYCSMGNLEPKKCKDFWRASSQLSTLDCEVQRSSPPAAT